MTPHPPRLADWLLQRVLPMGKRGESIRGDLLEEFHHRPSRRWYWDQTIRLTMRYLISESPQERLTYLRSNLMWFELTNDLKMALRSFRRAPGTSALIVLTLAFATGAATIGFAFADLALFRGLPVDDNAKVVSIFASDTHGSDFRARVSAPDLLDYRARTTTLEQLAAMRDGRAPLIRNGQSQTLTVTHATANLFDAMGQSPLLGRGFRPGEDAAGAAPVVVLSHHYWRDEFGSRADAIGSTLQIGREMVTVVGVMKPDLEFGNIADIDVWLPLTLRADGPRDVRNLRFMARLREGTTFDQAAAEIAAIGDALATEHPGTNAGWKVRLVPIRDLTGGDGFWIVIALFLLSIALLMAIATANVSNLVMVRSLARARELAVRTALGAKKGRLVRQFVTEGLVLSAIAAAISVPIAYAGLQAIQVVSAETVFRQLTIDLHELAFVAVLALVCPLVFSISPIRQLSRPDMRQVLASGGRGSTASMRGRGILVVVQVALAVILLTVASLALRSVRNLYAAPTGLDTAPVLIFGLEFNDAMFPSVEQARAVADMVRDELRGVTGVETVAMLSSLPILGDTGPLVMTIDNVVADAREARPLAIVTGASDGADRALGLTMRAGTWWHEGARDVAVIAETTAHRFFGGVESSLGRALSVAQGDRQVRTRVIGVVSDVANTDRTTTAPARVWIPLDPSARRVAYVVRAADPAGVVSQARSVVAAQAPVVPIEYLMTLDQALADAASSDYAVIGMLAGFALLALALATTGLFGVVSYAVAQRTAEFGTRMALGARSVDVVRLVARESAVMLAIGLAIGLAGGIGVAFMMGNVLYGLSPTDPLTLASVSGVLAAVTFAATALPAWKASRIDPVVALRSE